ncbi:hypothetical protein PT974_04734 [Cladobotryum mycophilum]|uniref:Uncharacterized protein n=1 Tax=Cladobotryum mycophilum TaxID=491253 RepID=A0ABR0SQS1_9HYPO
MAEGGLGPYSKQYYSPHFIVDLSNVIYDGTPDAVENFLRQRNAFPTVEDAQRVIEKSKLGPDFDVRFAGGAYQLNDNPAGAEVIVVNSVDRSISVDGVKVDFDQHTDGQISFTHNDHIFLVNFNVNLGPELDAPSRSFSGFVAHTSSADKRQEINGTPHYLFEEEITEDELAVVLDLIHPNESGDPLEETYEDDTSEPSESVEAREKHKARKLAEKVTNYSPSAVAWVINHTTGQVVIGTLIKLVGERLLKEYVKSQRKELMRNVQDMKLKKYDLDKKIKEGVEFESNYDHFAEATYEASADRVMDAVTSDYKLELQAQAEKAFESKFKFLYYLKGAVFSEAMDEAIGASWGQKHNSVHSKVLNAVREKLLKMTPETRADRMLSRLNDLKRQLDNMAEEVEDTAEEARPSNAERVSKVREAREKMKKEFERHIEEMEKDMRDHEGRMTQKVAEKMADKVNKLEEKNRERIREREKLNEYIRLDAARWAKRHRHRE